MGKINFRTLFLPILQYLLKLFIQNFHNFNGKISNFVLDYFNKQFDPDFKLYFDTLCLNPNEYFYYYNILFKNLHNIFLWKLK